MAALVVMVISPAAMVPPFRLDLPVRLGTASPVGRGVERVTEWVYHHPARVVVGLVAIVIPVASGMGRLTYESNYINAFKPESRVVRDYRAVESRLGGIGVVELVVPASGPVNSALMERFRAVENGLVDGSERGPRASYVLSLATVLDPDRRIAALPQASADRILAAKLDLIAASPQAELLRGFLNAREGKARILVRLVEQQPAADKAAIFDRATDLAVEAFGPGSSLTGLSFLMTKTTQGVITTQWTTFTWSVLGILLMLTIALRGPLLAILAILPTLLAVALVLGLMGWLGIKLDMATALVASVALGLSVDDTFHCLLQFHRYRASESFQPSLFASYAVTGPGVLLSSTAVAAGFLALRLSEFTPFSNFGAMVAVATAGSTIGNILLLPACLTLGERWSRTHAKKPVIAEVGG
jgi:predicted RND superfamily exporter protein